MPRLNSVNSLAKYSFFAIILAPLSAAFIGTVAFGGNDWTRWRIDFFTEALALLTLTPAILSWVSTKLLLIERAVKAGKGQWDFAYLYEVLKQGAD